MSNKRNPKTPQPQHRELIIDGVEILPGERKDISLQVASLYDYTRLHIPLVVIRGKSEGPVLFISAAIHGDEINGVEIIKRILERKSIHHIKGTLILAPTVNVFGFNNLSRYLPDRRDLNRSFPGSPKGSLASRVAHVFMQEVVSKCTHGIDLHTAASHRTNLSQIRACLDHEETRQLAEGFGVPVIINSKLRDGSLREAAREMNVATLLFEGGESLRFNEDVIRIGVRGCISVMQHIGMIRGRTKPARYGSDVFIATDTNWLRAPHSGSVRLHKKIGARVRKGDLLARVSNPFGEDGFDVHAEEDGIIIGSIVMPLVNEGDALFHIASFKNANQVKEAIDSYDDIVI